MPTTPAEKIIALEIELKHLRMDHEEIKAVALGNQRMLRWGMGACAGVGALVPILLPKISAALGIG